MAGERWTADETKRSLYLYFQLPFGRIHYRNPEIIALAQDLGRTPSSIAMKLANFASLDPKITTSGRRGLDGASKLDRSIWDEFHSDWTRLVIESEALSLAYGTGNSLPQTLKEDAARAFRPYDGPSVTTALVEQRRGQTFFRRAVLANYDEACCVTGIADPRLLNASHIVPWNVDEVNRHNPSNGLCLSATFDRAFDRGLITILPSLEMLVSNDLLNNHGEKTREYFEIYDGKKIRPSARFDPDPELIKWHNEQHFIDGRASAL